MPQYIVTDSEDKNYGTYHSEKKAYEAIRKNLELRNFKSYYYNQISVDTNKIRIDYGSHTHFFYIETVK
ncbi:MAG: hypothetical protein ACOCP4_02735 [Candidatus Woesearchaeota archaeon]